MRTDFRLTIREFPIIRGTLFWGPYKDPGYFIMVPYFRKLPYSTMLLFTYTAMLIFNARLLDLVPAFDYAAAGRG